MEGEEADSSVGERREEGRKGEKEYVRGCERKDGRKKRRETYLGLAPVLIDQVQPAVYW